MLLYQRVMSWMVLGNPYFRKPLCVYPQLEESWKRSLSPGFCIDGFLHV